MIEIRLDYRLTDDGPMLTGLWLPGWAWIMGGYNHDADITVHAKLHGTAAYDKTMLGELERLAKDCDYARCWPREPCDD